MGRKGPVPERMEGNSSLRAGGGTGSDSFGGSQPASDWGWFAPEWCCSARLCRRGCRDLLCGARRMSPRLPSLPGYPQRCPARAGSSDMPTQLLSSVHTLKKANTAAKEGTFVPEGRVGVLFVE